MVQRGQCLSYLVSTPVIEVSQLTGLKPSFMINWWCMERSPLQKEFLLGDVAKMIE